MAVLDDLSGFEFEDLMEDVLRNLGYENVRQASKTADEGRDVLMEEVVDGTRRGVVVECKHTGTVGRPVVQKLHSAVATAEFADPKRGIVVTTGRFTDPAVEYAEQLRANDDPYPIELIDGTDLRQIADEVGLDLYNGRIEILCDETLRPSDPTASVDAPVVEQFRDVDGIDAGDLPRPESELTLRPVVTVTADVDAVFETSVGVVHRVDDRTRLTVHADRDRPRAAQEDVTELVVRNGHSTVEVDESEFAETFDSVEQLRFGQTQTEYKDWAVDRVRRAYTETVHYTGDNNVDYEKECEPKQSDVSVQSVAPVYLPEITQTTRLGEYDYDYEYYAAGPSRTTSVDEIHECVHCSTDGDDGAYTYCRNCGAIACRTHTETERYVGEPVCTGCAVVERFALRTKYFYDEENLEAFREEYADLPPHQKAAENEFLVGGAAAAALVGVVALLLFSGVV
ncbi:restriction endonuclease [Halobaculum sp. MBLA0143]|uniref:restriction endonuclease n=1 Tax=Halobaculum sp. MBLA0143 TaxID=3079933 RepID=UPI00352494C4